MKTKEIKNYEGLYSITIDGKIWSHRGKGKWITPIDNGTGHLRVVLCKKGIKERFYIHRLVAEHFIGNIPEGMVVHHQDENPSNNEVSNLEICTPEYNISYSNTGKIPWNKGKRGCYSESTLRKIGAAHRGKTISEQHKAAIIESNKRRKKEKVS
jgi:hypothetical protein